MLHCARGGWTPLLKMRSQIGLNPVALIFLCLTYVSGSHSQPTSIESEEEHMCGNAGR